MNINLNVFNFIKPFVQRAENNDLIIYMNQFNDQCFFGWTNEGVIALVKKYSTQYPFAIYVSKGEESNILSQIERDSPAAIVYGISGLSMMNFDGRRMASRLPNVDKNLRENSPEKQQLERYLILRKAAYYE